MIWVLRTGAPWRDTPERYGKWTTIYSRFQHSRKLGVWGKMFSELQSALDVASNVDWEAHFISHRGGGTTKIHIRCEGTGRLITFLFTPGQESDITLAEYLMETGYILRRNGRLRLRPKRLVSDKGYISREFRSYLHHRNIRCIIPHCANEHHKGTFNKLIYRKRNIVERLINQLKQFRRIATLYEKRAANFSAMITLASIFLFSDFVYRH